MKFLIYNYDTRWHFSSILNYMSNKNFILGEINMKTIYKTLIFLPIISLIAFALLKFQKKSNKLNIGIMQIVEHESLDQARQGFIDEMKNLGYDADFDFQIAGGDISNCTSIAQKFVNDGKNLVLAISTPCAQSMMKETKDIPILATAITDFESSGLVDSCEHPGRNLTGTSDLAPIDKIIKIIPKINPNVKTIGILYSKTDPSPQYQAELASKIISDLGFSKKIYFVSQSNEIQQVAERIVNEVDALYVPIDKITSAAMPQISKIFLDHGKFVVCAEDAMISKGAIASYGVNYYELGKMTAHQADKILKGENPGNIPIQYLQDSKLNLNNEILKKLNLKITSEE